MMGKMLSYSCIFNILLGTWHSANGVEDDRARKVYEAIIRIEVAAQYPSYATPWNAGQFVRGVGTGFYIGENRFLTNAHVVSNARFVSVKKYRDPNQYEARVAFIAHDSDLALLELLDVNAFGEVVPLELGEIPALESEVTALGYPIGGKRISATRGVVSRIDFRSYSHSAADLHLAVQIDAAINPGNSGGPVMQEGKVAGVAFQGINAAVAQNVGYMIPVSVVKRFLTDISDGRYDRYVDLALSYMPLVNPSQRRALGLEQDGQGVIVTQVYAEGASDGVLQVEDVLLEIEGLPIASDGFVDFQGERVNLHEVVERRFAGDRIELVVWREGKREEVVAELKPYPPYLLQAQRYDEKPRYLVVGGMVFQPLTRNLVQAHGIADMEVLYHYNHYLQEALFQERPEAVIITQRLPHPINSHWGGYVHSMVDTVNDVKVRSLRDLAEAFRPKVDYYVVRCVGVGKPLVMKRETLRSAQSEIRESYQISQDAYLGEGGDQG